MGIFTAGAGVFNGNISGVYPISMLQTEYSLWTREPQKPEDIPSNDFRKNLPRFKGENFEKNLKMVDKVKTIAKEKNCSPAQLALAWLLAQGEDIIPIPGTKHRKRLEENLDSIEINLNEDDLKNIEEIAPIGAASGTRYPEAVMHTVNR